MIGSLPVCRVLPQRPRRTVGAWCFADHIGPVALTGDGTAGIGPHPHMGLQTVTWLLAGELLHLDSLGSEQLIRPGQLNLMTAGHGVAHAEEDRGRTAEIHGIQLWVAQPDSTRHGAAAFEHHAELPRLELSGVDGTGTTAVATLLVGRFGDLASPARRDSDHFGVELALSAGRTLIPLRQADEHALIVLAGGVSVDSVTLGPGALGYLATGREECVVEATSATRALLLGGVPFSDPLHMWWNFVAPTRGEMSDAWRQWTATGERFGTVASMLPRIDVEPPPWEAATTPPTPEG